MKSKNAKAMLTANIKLMFFNYFFIGTTLTFYTLHKENHIIITQHI